MAKQSAVLVESREASSSPGLVQLERQVERGQKFAHTALGESFLRLGEIEVFLHGLIDSLIEKGVVDEKEVLTAAHNVRSELLQRGELRGARTVVRSDDSPEGSKPPVKVDCSARMHICHAVCCKLSFALNISEVESGKAKWDLGKPYFIRQDSHGSCVHLDSLSGGCRIYNDRPGVCRGYSCANDPRIWKDFEKMELNHEWIDGNLSTAAEPQVIRSLMHRPSQLTQLSGAGETSERGDRP